jgi:hypothetical protein
MVRRVVLKKTQAGAALTCSLLQAAGARWSILVVLLMS